MSRKKRTYTINYILRIRDEIVMTKITTFNPLRAKYFRKKDNIIPNE